MKAILNGSVWVLHDLTAKLETSRQNEGYCCFGWMEWEGLSQGLATAFQDSFSDFDMGFDIGLDLDFGRWRSCK